MALQLLRIASVTPVVTPTNYEYFRKASVSINVTSGTSYALPRSTWFKDNGAVVTAFATVPFYHLSVNGVLQQAGLYTVTASTVKLIGPAGGIHISLSSPITLDTFNTTTTPTNVAVP